MNIVVKVPLSEARIANMIGDMNFVKNSIEIANVDIVKKLCEKGKQLGTSYNATAPKSGLEDNKVDTIVTDGGEGIAKGYVWLQGPNAVYDEFGTGEEGAADAHPLKGSTFIPLNPYNSGPFVSTHVNKQGRHYWFYSPMGNTPNFYFRDKGYTEGIPSGKQMYRTLNDLQKEKQAIAIAEINKALSILKD